MGRKQASVPTQWTAEEDELLAHWQSIIGNKWSEISQHIPDKSGQQCAQRWRHRVNPSINRARWTPEEDEHLIELVAQHGNAWAVIARGMVGRTDQQCMGRWKRTLDPAVVKGKWSEEEDAQLVQLVNEMGTAWSEVAAYMKNRNAAQCRVHYMTYHMPQNVSARVRAKAWGKIDKEEQQANANTRKQQQAGAKKKKPSQQQRQQEEDFKADTNRRISTRKRKYTEDDDDEDEDHALYAEEQQPVAPPSLLQNLPVAQIDSKLHYQLSALAAKDPVASANIQAAAAAAGHGVPQGGRPNNAATTTKNTTIAPIPPTSKRSKTAASTQNNNNNKKKKPATKKKAAKSNTRRRQRGGIVYDDDSTEDEQLDDDDDMDFEIKAGLVAVHPQQQYHHQYHHRNTTNTNRGGGGASAEATAMLPMHHQMESDKGASPTFMAGSNGSLRCPDVGATGGGGLAYNNNNNPRENTNNGFPYTTNPQSHHQGITLNPGGATEATVIEERGGANRGGTTLLQSNVPPATTSTSPALRRLSMSVCIEIPEHPESQPQYFELGGTHRDLNNNNVNNTDSSRGGGGGFMSPERTTKKGRGHAARAAALVPSTTLNEQQHQLDVIQEDGAAVPGIQQQQQQQQQYMSHTDEPVSLVHQPTGAALNTDDDGVTSPVGNVMSLLQSPSQDLDQARTAFLAKSPQFHGLITPEWARAEAARSAAAEREAQRRLSFVSVARRLEVDAALGPNASGYQLGSAGRGGAPASAPDVDEFAFVLPTAPCAGAGYATGAAAAAVENTPTVLATLPVESAFAQAAASQQQHQVHNNNNSTLDVAALTAGVIHAPATAPAGFTKPANQLQHMHTWDGAVGAENLTVTGLVGDGGHLKKAFSVGNNSMERKESGLSRRETLTSSDVRLTLKALLENC